MPNIREALDDLALIRGQLAKSSKFQGFGPITVAASGALALMVATMQPQWLQEPRAHPQQFIAIWYATAVVSIMLIGIEVLIRARRVHGGMAATLIQQVVVHFCPSLVAGALLTVILLRASPTAAWQLPGLWEILFSFGAFAMAPMLPRPMFAVGVWYLLCGLVCIQMGPMGALSGWSMGVPFGVGQLMVAVILVARDRIEG